jgi:UDP-N-acetylglucosamine acyltransferase
VIGGEPQDLGYRGADTQVLIGDGNLIRENVTINRASEKEEGITRIGNHCFIMANCHVAHDCCVGDNVVMANLVMLGGHVHIHDNVTMGGGVGVHHFGSVGKFAFVGAMSRVTQDVAPFMLADGNPARAHCVNLVALKRKNFSREAIRSLNEVFRLLYRSRVGAQNAREILGKDGHATEEALAVLDFVEFSNAGRNGRGRDRRRAVA